MSGKINNKTLLIVFIGLAGILIITKLVTSKKNVRTLETELVQIDTSKVTGISIFAQAESGEEVSFTRNNQVWKVSKGSLSATADPMAVQYLLDALLNIKTERLVAKSEEKWVDFQVMDSVGTRIIIEEGRKKTLDLIIGRFQYKPPPGGNQGYQQNQISGESYVRKHSEVEVYAVEGFLALSLNQNFNAWRNQTITQFVTSQISKIVFEYPADSGFIAQKSQSGWLVAGLPADSISMVQYLGSISNKRSSAFENGFQPSGAPDYQLTIEGNNMNPILIRAFLQEGGDLILNSSLNTESWFRTTPDDLFAQFYKRPVDFTVLSSNLE